MGKSEEKERLLKYFNYKEPSNSPNTSIIPNGSLPFPGPDISLAPSFEIELASLTLENIRPKDRILLNATIGWDLVFVVGSQNIGATMSFKIIRDKSTIVFETQDSAFSVLSFAEGIDPRLLADIPTPITTNFTHIETSGNHHHKRTYTLTATLVPLPAVLSTVQSKSPLTTAANIIGPISFYGSVIDENNT